MKTKPLILSILFLIIVRPAFGQGFIVYDQQSTNLIEGAFGIDPSAQPVGQSFTPTLTLVGFIDLYLYDGDPLHDLGGTVYVNLRSDSITGTILASSTPVFLPDSFLDFTNFSFATPVAVTPGVTYFFQPVIQSGNLGFGSGVTDASYAGGSAFYQGNLVVDRNLWFREGILAVPEPSPIWLAWLGGAAWLFSRRRFFR
jgi:uncharacterized protein (TIGR03382 family)